MAAVNIGGTTVHSWAGVGLGEGPPAQLLQDIRRSRRKSRNWLDVKALVIDEISMLDGGLFDALELIARGVRQDERPFGGVQLVLCGDFFQLPPVGLERGTSFCFDARTWAQIVPPSSCCVLTKVFRQRDEAFVRMLDEVRRGGDALSPATRAALLATERTTFGDRVEPTRLYSHNVDVDRINGQRLAELPGEPTRFVAEDKGQHPYLGQLQKHCRAPEDLVLKPGAQVLLLKNLDPAAGLVNGARGVVVRLAPDKRSGEMLPVVDMHVPHTAEAQAPGGASAVVTRLLRREEWTVELGGKVVACRRQVPLRLAWAISIHKSQGMTIDALEADLGLIFEFGQAYVALSRATCLERLRALNFTPDRVKTHPRVAAFGRRLEESHRFVEAGSAAPGPFVCGEAAGEESGDSDRAPPTAPPAMADA